VPQGQGVRVPHFKPSTREVRKPSPGKGKGGKTHEDTLQNSLLEHSRQRLGNKWAGPVNRSWRHLHSFHLRRGHENYTDAPNADGAHLEAEIKGSRPKAVLPKSR